VRAFLEKFIDQHKPLRILELGCGTGEDALYLARKGHYVHATDISGKMIEVARNKAARENLSGRATFQALDMRELEKINFTRSFDLVFSNFGAINCISPQEINDLFKKLVSNLVENAHGELADEILTREGSFIGVIMPRYCLWESMYFLLKGHRKLIFRRKKSKGIHANLQGQDVTTWYYSPGEIKKLSNENFRAVHTRPIGFFLPPSYMNPFFSNKRWLLRLLSGLERMVSKFSLLSGSSDHYIFELKRKT
jgi:SAM-dependent methyltransferase